MNELDKLRLDLVPLEAQEAIARVMMEGCKKYGENSWADEPEIYTPKLMMESILRHIHEYRTGVTKDEETGLHPLKHALTRMAMMVAMIDRQETKPSTEEERKEAIRETVREDVALFVRKFKNKLK